MKIGVLSFTDKGRLLEERLKAILLKDEIMCPSENKKLWVEEVFNKVNAMIFIGAAGIAVRYIAPHIKSKDVDPAVIVIDELGKFVIPILAGHIGGANALSEVIAQQINATAVITTATDINNILAIDTYATEKGYVITDISKIKYISSSLLKGEEVGFYSDLKHFQVPEDLKEKSSGKIGVSLSYDPNSNPFELTLNLVPRNLVLGIGCKRETQSEIMKTWIVEKLKELNISTKAIKSIASIDLKKDEDCILELSKYFNVEFKTFSAEELEKVQGSKATSDFVKSITGVDNVCERAAILESKGSLVIEKIAANGMTLAIAGSGIK